MQYGFYINSAKCTGCKTCQVSCKDEKDNALGINFRRVYEYGGGTWQQVDGCWQNDTFIYYLSVSCNHCQEPTCVQGCPTGAMHKRQEDGLVVVNQDICIGCRYCEMRCPYGAPHYDHQKRVMSKCDGCYERVSQGLKPVCVESCPQRALDFDEIGKLRELYGHECDIAPLPSSELTKPSIVIKPHPQAKVTAESLGSILNPEEV